jgi:hypothetical protein
MNRRNADGQFPKKYDHSKKQLHEAMGFTNCEAALLVMKWNELLSHSYTGSRFLQEADMVFTKHELLFVFTLSSTQG